jgi:hypothetical protein
MTQTRLSPSSSRWISKPTAPGPASPHFLGVKQSAQTVILTVATPVKRSTGPFGNVGSPNGNPLA